MKGIFVLLILSQPIVCGIVILYILIFVRSVGLGALLTIPAAVLGFWLSFKVHEPWFRGGYGGGLVTLFLSLGGCCAAFIFTTGVVCIVNKTYRPAGIAAVVHGLSFPVSCLILSKLA
jgi:hypothetical protein